MATKSKPFSLLMTHTIVRSGAIQPGYNQSWGTQTAGTQTWGYPDGGVPRPGKLGLVADPVIKVIARLEFEDGLRTGVLLRDCWSPWGGRTYPRINYKPLWGCRLVLGWVWLSEAPHFRPNSNILGSAHWWYYITAVMWC